MKVLVVGNGGREHVLIWKLNQSNKVNRIFAAPGNAGTAEIANNIDIEAEDIDGLLDFAVNEKIDLTFVGPEAPLAAGIVDCFREKGLKIFGPDAAAAKLEGSKVFSKNLMMENNIPTAQYSVFTDPYKAVNYIEMKGAPIVVKAEGLAAGKGVVVADNTEKAVEAVKKIMVKEKFGEAGQRIVVEEYLEGEEATVLAFVDAKTIKTMLPSQDHKPAFDGGKGPNTGGMGAYAPAPIVDKSMMDKVVEEILEPTVKALKDKGITYKGILYCGLMIKNGQAKVLEFNVRFGDPEAQVILPLLQTDLIDIVEAILEDRLECQEISWQDKKSVAVIMASGGYPLNYEKAKVIEGIDSVNECNDLKVFQAGTACENGKIVTNGGRVLAVTAVGNEFNSTIVRVYQGVEKIRFKDAHFRTDIGHRVL